MNNALISDPFLYPPSGEDIFRGAFLPKKTLEYSENQFKQAWEIASGDFATTARSFKLWPSVISSKISSSSQDLLDLLESAMDSQNSTWLDQTNFSLSEEDELCDFGQILEQKSYPLDSSVPGPTLFGSLPDLDTIFKDDDIFMDKEAIATTTPANPSTEEPTPWPYSIDLDPQIQETLMQQFTTTNLLSLIDPSVISPVASEEAINAEPAVQQQQPRSRRKSHQVSRVAATESSFQILNEEDSMSNYETVEVEMKPNLAALSTINGNGSRGKKRALSTSTEQASSSGTKRKRKYEIEDPNDTSVKNAKAAKLNRDRKKREMAELKEKVDTVLKENSLLKEQNANLMAEKAEAEKKYKLEKDKNLVNNGLVGQLTNAKRILELIVPPLINNLGPMNVSVSEAFANIPVRTDEYNNIILPEVPSSHDSNFAGADAVSTYTTVHISPQERTIKVDYDPHYFG